jgi:transglutaminase-like putative cysteine protease
MNDYLAATEAIDWQQPDVSELAMRLAKDAADTSEIARRCFEWVRDEVQHSVDFGRNEVTCRASEVLAARTGFCYAKSHLLAALLRANRIPAALCYQRLSIDGHGPPYCLHGLNAVHLPEGGWYRIDARGNKPGVDARFTPPVERLAFRATLFGETDLPGFYAEPLAVVCDVLRRYDAAVDVAANLPDDVPR